MLVKHISFVFALLFAFALVSASPPPSKRAPAPHPAPSKRAPAPAPWPAPSKRAPYPAPSKRAPVPAPAPSKRAPAPVPSMARRAPAPAPSKRALEPEMTESDTEATSSILACQELNHPSDASTSEFLSIFDIVLSEVDAAKWVGLDCERVVDGDLVKRGTTNFVNCARISEGGLIATGCTRL
ncbi:hypothetical protein SCHPADRAFT_890060 [Schizopora paradoxa]|uniref:Hydrophobin n=1 Tax=Schizopora paradoxa TaxID=27342 RepID=A0A0H2S998_9AGAM|nr:hypothetical protein SCHPADRAFT_890060 [Schizopora paradoxa]